MNAVANLPWRLTFSYGRALQDPAMRAWAGQSARVEVGQRALLQRARLNSAAALGTYDESMETSTVEPVLTVH
jgi:fructose-bisphosphate aldolase class I